MSMLPLLLLLLLLRAKYGDLSLKVHALPPPCDGRGGGEFRKRADPLDARPARRGGGTTRGPRSGVARGVLGPRCPQDSQGGSDGLQGTPHEVQEAPGGPKLLEKLGAPWARDTSGNTRPCSSRPSPESPTTNPHPQSGPPARPGDPGGPDRGWGWDFGVL